MTAARPSTPKERSVPANDATKRRSGVVSLQCAYSGEQHRMSSEGTALTRQRSVRERAGKASCSSVGRKKSVA
jgi:hypothetical protein